MTTGTPAPNSPASNPSTGEAPRIDPRTVFAPATEWVGELMAALTADDRDLPTPCSEFTVDTLSRHLIGLTNRAIALAEGSDALLVPPLAEDSDAATYASTAARAVQLWSDDKLLTTPMHVPWGEVPGAGALWGYVNETLVHGWDLAIATCQNPEAPTGLAEATLPVAQQFIPAHIRGEIPFDAVVVPREEAGATERLANWSGHRRP